MRVDARISSGMARVGEGLPQQLFGVREQGHFHGIDRQRLTRRSQANPDRLAYAQIIGVKAVTHASPCMGAKMISQHPVSTTNGVIA